MDTQLVLGAADVAPDNGMESIGPRVDIARGVFIASNGEEFVLKTIKYLIFQRITSSTKGKPDVPEIAVPVPGGNGAVRKEKNPNDPIYLERLKEWETERGFRGMLYLFTAGVKGEPDPEFMEQMREYSPESTQTELKYLWVCSRLPELEIADLVEAIVGQNAPTEKGLADSAESFRGDGERAAN